MNEFEGILTVENLSKEYIKDGKPLHVLKNVSFELKSGEILGVIGRNGSGKSTLLKVLSQITGPTSGEISYEGHLTSIIDIGTGFHADLSGEENVYLSAMLLGLSKREVKVLYEQIVDFSGLHDFMQMPVKHYSSGMYLRLAFSIAFHSSISILLLDEVIAVGDTDFKRKCYAKIKELKARGVAIILVSHHLELIVEQCDRCILLDHGKVLCEGNPLDVVNEYYEMIENNSGASIRSAIDQDKQTDDFSLLVPFPIVTPNYTIDRLKINEVDKEHKLTTSSEITIEFSCSKFDSETSFEIGITLINLNGVRVLLDSYGFRKNYHVQPMKSGSYQVQVKIPFDLLSAGVYRIGLILCTNREPIQEVEAVAKFRLYSNDDLEETHGMGSVIRPKLNWNLNHFKD
jgi:lipopolysaccharide transport system ATP-binding protein